MILFFKKQNHVALSSISLPVAWQTAVSRPPTRMAEDSEEEKLHREEGGDEWEIRWGGVSRHENNEDCGVAVLSC